MKIYIYMTRVGVKKDKICCLHTNKKSGSFFFQHKNEVYKEHLQLKITNTFLI